MKNRFSGNKLLHSISANFSREATTSLGQLLLTPLYIARFGPTDYGILLLLTSYSSFIVLSDFGLSTAVIVRIKKFGLGANSRLWNQFVKITYVLAFCISCLVFLFLCEYYVRKGKNHHGFEFYSSIIFLLIFLSIQTLRQHFYLYQIQIMNSYDKGMRSLFLIRISEIMVLALALVCQVDIFRLLIINIVIREFLFYIFNKSVKIQFKRKLKDEFSNEESRVYEIIRPAIGNGLISLSIIIGIHGSFALAATWVDPKSLVALNLTRMLVSPIRLVSGSLILGSLPHFISAENEISLVALPKSLFKYLINFIFIIFFSAIIVLLTSNLLWEFLANNSFEYSLALVVLFTISSTMDSLCQVRIQIPTARNRTLRLGILLFSTTLLSLIIQLLIKGRFGLSTVPISIILADLIFLIISITFRRILR